LIKFVAILWRVKDTHWRDDDVHFVLDQYA
jgi:hypothetical protein